MYVSVTDFVCAVKCSQTYGCALSIQVPTVNRMHTIYMQQYVLATLLCKLKSVDSLAQFSSCMRRVSCLVRPAGHASALTLASASTQTRIPMHAMKGPLPVTIKVRAFGSLVWHRARVHLNEAPDSCSLASPYMHAHVFYVSAWVGRGAVVQIRAQLGMCCSPEIFHGPACCKPEGPGRSERRQRSH